MLFAGIDEELSRVRPKPDGWCAREIVGHLIDSACNNHRRWIVGQTPGLAKFDGYEQNVWVSRQQYAEESWADVVALWAAYNRHLRHVISRTPAEHMLLSGDLARRRRPGDHRLPDAGLRRSHTTSPGAGEATSRSDGL